MSLHTRCVVGICANEKRFPDKMIKHSNVQGDVKMHKLPVDNERKRAWIAQVSKERKDFQPPKKFFVCSNHFVDGKPSKEHPDPTLFLTISTNTAPTTKKKRQLFPRSRKMLNVEEPYSSNNFSYTEIVFESNMAEPQIKVKETMTDDYQESVPMRFCQLTRESDVLFYTGLENTRIFQTVFNYLQKKTSVMTYWDGSKKPLKPRKGLGSIELTEVSIRVKK